MKKVTKTARQLHTEIKLTSLVPRKNRVLRELKKIIPVSEWKSLQTVIAEFYSLSEAEAVTDDQIEKLIQQAAAELKLPKPKDVNVDAVEKGEDDAIDIQKEQKQSLQESLAVAAILAAPTILKLIANIIDWVYRTFALKGEEKKKYEEEAAAYQYAKKTGKLPDGTEVDEHKLHDMEDNLYKSKAGKVVLSLAHKLHSLYVKPLRVIIAGLIWVGSDPGAEYGGKGKGTTMMDAWKKAKKPAEIIYAVIMIGIAGYGAIHAVTSIPSAMEAVKSVGGLSHLATATIDATKGGDMTATVIKGILKHVHI